MRSLHTATKSSPCSPQLEKACAQLRRPNAAKNKNKINKYFLKIKGKEKYIFPRRRWGEKRQKTLKINITYMYYTSQIEKNTSYTENNYL